MFHQINGDRPFGPPDHGKKATTKHGRRGHGVLNIAHFRRGEMVNGWGIVFAWNIIHT